MINMKTYNPNPHPLIPRLSYILLFPQMIQMHLKLETQRLKVKHKNKKIFKKQKKRNKKEC